MPSSPPLPPKKEVALALLANSSVYVHLDPRLPGVVVPPWFKKQPQLVLQIGLNMPVPIPDLHLDEDGLSCTLSFNRAPFHCVVPWTAVYAMVDDEHRAMVWPDDVPPEVQQSARPRPVEAVPPPQAAPARRQVGSKDAKKGSRIAEVRADEARPARTKKQGKLSAVPPPRKSEPAAADAQELKGEEPRRPVAAPAPPPSEPAPPAAAGGGSRGGARPVRPAPPVAKKAKRELPPYLRVVK